MNKILVTLLLMLLPAWLWASTPVLFFSDLTDGATSGWNGSGTQGAAVSIWGLNFGESGTITVANATAETSVNIPSSTCAEWAATTNPTTARGLQRITFWLSSDMGTSGTAPNSTIKVTTSEGTSNSINFHCRTIGSNHIYFFATDGDDDTGDGSLSKPWNTGEKAREILQAGDVGYFRAGTYTSIDSYWPDYGSFIYCRTGNHNNGSAYNTITISAYPAELVQIGTYNNNTQMNFFRHIYGVISYWTISKFKAHTCSAPIVFGYDTTAGDSNIRFVGNDIRSRYASQSFAFSLMAGNQGSAGMNIIGNYINKVGRPLAPETAPTLSIGVGTGLTGTYKAKYLYARNTDNTQGDDPGDCYSDLSPAATAVTLSNGALRVSWPESYDHHSKYPFNQVLIYRTKAGGSTYYYDQTVPYSGAGYVDTTTSDDDLGSEEVPYGYKVEAMYVQGFGKISDLEVAWNEIAYCNGPGQFYGHFTADELTLLKFYNNFVHHGGSQLVFGGGDPGSGNEYAFIKTAYIYNNIIAQTNGATRMAYPSGQGWHGGDYYVYNNIFYDCGSSYSFIVVGPSVYEMKNNIVYSLASSGDYFTYEVAGITGDAPGSCYGDHNLWYGPGAGPTWSTTGDLDNTDPAFAGATPTSLTGYFPTESSPTIGTGTVLSYGKEWDTYDFYGVSRGTMWDIGAFEYESEGSSTPTCQGISVQGGIMR